MSAVLDAAYQLVHAYPGGAAALGARMGKNATTLSHEVRGTGSAKLGLDDAVMASVMADDRRILNAFAAECGCLVLQLPSSLNGDSTSLERVSQLAKEFSDLVATVTAAKADGMVTANELALIERDGAEMMRATQGLLAHLRSVHEASVPTGGAQ